MSVIHSNLISVTYLMAAFSLFWGWMNFNLAQATYKDPKTGIPATLWLVGAQLAAYLFPVIAVITHRSSFPEWFRSLFLFLVVFDTFAPYLIVTIWYLIARLVRLRNQQKIVEPEAQVSVDRD